MRISRLFKDFAIYGFSDIILKASAFISLPIYTRLFTPDDYGIWNFISTVVGLLSAILILGGDSAYARFFFEVKTLEDKQHITSTWLSFLAIWSVAIILLSLPFTGLFSVWSFKTTQYHILFILALLTAPLSLINSMCGQALRNQFRAKLFGGLNILTTALSIGFSLTGAIGLQLGLIGVIGGTFVATLVMLPVRLWTIRSLLRPVFSFSLLKSLLAYGVPLVPASLAYWVFASSDRLILGKLSTLEELGLYSIANSITSILAFANSAFGQAWSPHAVQLYEEQPMSAPSIYGQIMTYILVGFGILCVATATFAREILMILSTPAFYPAALAVGPLAFGFVAYASTQITAAGIALTKQTKYLAIFSWIAALLNLGLNFLLVPQWGMIAASWTTAIAYIFLTFAYLVTSQKLWPIRYEIRRSILAVILTFIFTVLASFLPQSSWLLDWLIKLSYLLLFCSLLIILRVLDQREWQKFQAFIFQRTIMADPAE